jgi:hypothetical protein
VNQRSGLSRAAEVLTQTRLNAAQKVPATRWPVLLNRLKVQVLNTYGFMAQCNDELLANCGTIIEPQYNQAASFLLRTLDDNLLNQKVLGEPRPPNWWINVKFISAGERRGSIRYREPRASERLSFSSRIFPPRFEKLLWQQK